MNNIYEKSIIASATITNKSENQDCNGEFEGNDFKALFIADGLGSYKYAKQSSERIIDFFVNDAKNFEGKIQDTKFTDVYKLAKQKLIDFAKEIITEEDKQDENLFGTTLISVIETDDKIKISYVGNGAIWHIRGNFNEFPSSYLFPWNAINILNPHTIPENGKEVLYRLISNNEDFTECIPSVIELEKDNEYGDIIMICTDGIYSVDQIKAGKNEKGTWVKYEPSMLKFFENISRFFVNIKLYNKEGIEQILKQYLEEIKLMLDDDATIGILISQKTLNYQNEINWQKNEIDSGNSI